MNNNSKSIILFGANYGVNLAWQEFNGSKGVIRNKIKDAIKKKRRDGYGINIEISKNKSLIGFANKKTENIKSLAYLLSQNSDFLNSFVLIHVKENLFWTCNIDKNGIVETGSDSLYDTDGFVSVVNDYISLLPDDESELKILVYEENNVISKLIENDIMEYNVGNFDLEKILNESTDDTLITLVFNKKAELIKQAVTLALFGVISIGSYYFIFLEKPIYNKIINQEFSDGFRESERDYKKFVEYQNKNIEKAYKNMAKIEVIKKQNSTYSNNEIYDNLYRISNMFPFFLVEWEFTNILYNHNLDEYFEVKFKRIEDSFGNSVELKNEIAKILKNNNISIYKIIATKKNEIDVIFNFKKRKDVVFSDLNDIKIKKSIKIKSKEIELLANDIEAIEDDTYDTSFFNKRFGSTLERERDQILDIVEKIKDKYIKIKAEWGKLNQNDIKIDEEIVAGSFLKIEQMQQVYSYYGWQNEKTPVFYPIVRKELKKTKAKRRIYAKSETFKLSFNGNIDLLGIDGMNDLLTSKLLLNKPYIKIKSINLNIQTEEWSAKGEYYEKI